MEIFLPLDLSSSPFCHILINLYLVTTFIMVQKLCSKGPSYKAIAPDKFQYEFANHNSHQIYKE